ncbi:DUF2730 family protein [Vibrio quintilis]|uniref:DUF2730 domain-containing protein n=1 Tax=Vibrio quintilis TaxID=1117707 RepID=A0A1M7Z1X9_9VIBR|nr:DUF2730 family protein [Vibrio quintilis]SHO58780.1 hypothetical protein VQ7734_04552 [Vibrio quintilis]
MSLEEIRTYTPWMLAGLSIIWTVVLLMINKTYATKKEVNALRSDHEQLKNKVEDLPSHDEINSLKVSIETLRGDIKEIRPQLYSLQKMSDLLIENELKEKA